MLHSFPSRPCSIPERARSYSDPGSTLFRDSFRFPVYHCFQAQLSGSSPCCSRPLADEFLRIREIMFCTTHSTYTSKTFCACWFHRLSSMCYSNTLAYTALPHASEILLSFHRERSFSFFWNTRAATTLRAKFSSPPGQ